MVKLPDRLRILLVLTPSFHPNAGGVQMSTWKIGRYLAEKGHDISIFSFATGGHLEQDFATLYSCSLQGGSACSENLKKLQGTLDEVLPSIVINQMPYEHSITRTLSSNSASVKLACLRNSLFSVVNDIDQFASRALPTKLRPLFRNRLGRFVLTRYHVIRHRRDLKQILGQYDRFIMFGPPNIEELKFFLPNFEDAKVCLIPNSIADVQDSVPKKEKRLLWLGRLTYAQKRIELLLPIWRIVSAALPDWELDIVGDGPAYDDLELQINTEGIARANLVGRQQPDKYFSRSPIFLMTSAFEGFPNTVVEAQSFGAVPILFNTFPIANWMVENGRNGFLIEPFDIEAMAKTIIEIAERSDQATLMSNAIENARRFHIDAVGEKWEALFADILQNRADLEGSHK